MNKLVDTFKEAVSDIPDGATVLISKFSGPSGAPYYLVHALRDQGAINLVVVASTAGGDGMNIDYDDHKILFENRQVKKVISNFPFSPSASRQSPAEKQILAGEIELELLPLGTFVEKIRCGAAGIPAFYTSTGYDTVVAKGKEVRWFDGRPYLLEHAIKGDYALVRAYKADKLGNLIFRGTQRHHNPIMAMNARITIAEVDEVVAVGALNPEEIEVPAAFVHRIVKVKDNPGFPRHLERNFWAE